MKEEKRVGGRGGREWREWGRGWYEMRCAGVGLSMLLT